MLNRSSRYHAFGFVLLVALVCQIVAIPLLNFVPEVQAAEPDILPSSVSDAKWVVSDLNNGESGVLIADVNGDGYEDVIRCCAGNAYAFNGLNGAQIWRYSNENMSDMAKPQMYDLDGDGGLEIIVNLNHGAMALRANNGWVYWMNNNLATGNHWSSPVVGVIDGSGHPTVFVAAEDADTDERGGRITALSYNGQVLYQTFGWRACFGGLSLADSDGDGEFELFACDRGMNFGDDGYGRGVRCFWARNLTLKWERPEFTCSSHIPMLVDINGDGILEVVAGQTGETCVLDSRDGSFIRPSIDNSAARYNFPVHFQPSIYDIDRDGHPELLMADAHDNTAMDVVAWDLVDWVEDGRVYVGECYYGPKAADVNGDGVMELIACSYGTVSIINGSDFTVLDSLSVAPEVYWSRLTYALVQDIDNDNEVELVVSSFSGPSGITGASIWAFELKNSQALPGIQVPVPVPRARTEVQHYSERRLGAAEYVSPPSSTPNPLIMNATPVDKSANVPVALANLRFTLRDYQDNLMSYSVVTSPDIGSWSESGISSGTVISLPIGGLSYSTIYSWEVNVTDSDGHLLSRDFTFKTEFAPVSNVVPTQGSPVITSSSLPPTSGDSLACSNQSTADADGNPVTNIFNWFEDEVSFANLLLPFDTRNEVTTKDYSGKNNNAIVYGATWTGAGIVGGCYEFNSGTNIRVPYSTSLDGNGTWTEITVECWVYLNGNQNGTRIVSKTHSYEIGISSSPTYSNRLYAAVWTDYDGYRATSTYTLSANTWYHVVMTYNDGMLRLYVNGTQRQSRTWVGPISSASAFGPYVGQYNAEPVYIGWYNSFKGKIDEVRIYPRELSSQQVYQRYNETRFGSSNSSVMTSQETLDPSIWTCEVTPNDGYADGETKISNIIALANQAPVASNLRFPLRVGSQMLTTDDLLAVYDFFDLNGDIESGSEIRWYKDGELQPPLNDSLVVPQASTSAGENWYFTVRPSDGELFGDLQTSSTVSIIYNAWPSQATPSLTGFRDDDELVGRNQTTADNDGDVVTNVYNWLRNGVSFTRLNLPFNTNNAMIANDYSGYNNYGTLTGPTWNSNGLVGGCYSFGGNDVIAVADSASLGNDGSWSQITLEYWVNPSVDQRGTRIINKNGGDAGTSGKYMTGFNTYSAPYGSNEPPNCVFFGVTIDNSYLETYNEATTVIPTSSWSHVVCTYQSGVGIRIYINGTLCSSEDGVTGNIDASVGEPLFIGYASADPGTANRYLTGLLDEVRIYPTALSGAQVFQNFVDQKDGLSNSSTIVPQETSYPQNWRVQVTPNDGWQDGTMLQSNLVTLTEDNTKPRIDWFSPSEGQVSTKVGYGVNFTQVSSDPSGSALSYNWTLDGGQQATTQNWTYTPLTASLHTVRVTVLDGTNTDYQEWIVDVTDPEYVLTVTVNPSEGGDWSPDIPAPYYFGDVVTISPSINPGYEFGGWSGDGTAGVDNTWVVNMTNSMDVVETFYAINYTLTVNIVGNGTVLRVPDQEYYAYGTLVALNADADDGWMFTDWSGDLDSYDIDESVTMITNMTVTATFSIENYTLTVDIEGNGVVDVVPEQATYTYGTQVNLTATADLDYMFSGWSGDFTSIQNPLSIIINGTTSLTATFNPISTVQYGLLVQVGEAGGGTTNATGTTLYFDGDIVDVLASPDMGWKLSHWLLNNTEVGSANPYSVVMSENRNLTAVFTEEASAVRNVYLVVRGGDDRIFYCQYDAGEFLWGGWDALPSGTTVDTCAAATVDDQLYVVVRGSDGVSLWFSSVNLTDSSFSGWTLLSGWTPSIPTLSSNGTHLGLVVRGGDDRIYYRFYDVNSESWSDWNVLPSGTTIDSPTATLVGDVLHVVVRGSDGVSLWHCSVDTAMETFSGWVLLSGSSPSIPTLSSNSSSLALVVRGGDDRIYYQLCDLASETWLGWSALASGTTVDSPAATVVENELFVVVRGSDGFSIWQSSVNLDTSVFSGWSLLGGSTPSRPTLTS